MFASIHHALAKELHKYGIYSNLLEWTKSYTPEEWAMLGESYDLIVTKVDGLPKLLSQGIPPEKLAGVSHAEWDYLLTTQGGQAPEFYSQIRKFGAVSPWLVEKSAELGIPRVPDLVTLGVFFDVFHSQPKESLSVLGYAGARDTKDFRGNDIKRGKLVYESLPQGVELHEHQFYNWMCMPAYYPRLDAVAITSSQEGAGLPSMEAACAGRLVLSTLVGVFREHGPRGGGIVLPLEENELKTSLYDYLSFYRDNPEVYRRKCREIQEYARENYDWSKHIEAWVRFLS